MAEEVQLDLFEQENETEVDGNPLFVMAQEMSLEEYLQLRGWSNSGDDPCDAKGYVVQRNDLVGHDPRFPCLVYWVPKEEFDTLYAPALVEDRALH